MAILDTFTLTVGEAERQMLLDALEILSPDRPSGIHMKNALLRRIDRLQPEREVAMAVARKLRSA